MATFNEYLLKSAGRPDPVGLIGTFWKSLDNKPRVHAPTGVENHLLKLGDAYTQELRMAFAAAADEYRNERAAPGTRIDGPDQAIISLGAIHQALRALSLQNGLILSRQAVIALKLGIELPTEDLPEVAPMPAPQPAADRAQPVAEPSEALDWASVYQLADFRPPESAQESA